MIDEQGRLIVFGEFAFFRERRERLGLTTDEIADAIGMNRWLYAVREVNPLRLNLDDVVMLGDVLGFEITDFAHALDRYLGWKPRT